MNNNDFAASLRESARTEEEYKNHIEEQKRKEEELRRKKEKKMLCDSFVKEFKQIIQKSLSEGKFNIENINGKKIASGEIHVKRYMSFRWDYQDRGRKVGFGENCYCSPIISNKNITLFENKYGDKMLLPCFFEAVCTNAAGGAPKIITTFSSPKIKCIQTPEEKQNLSEFLFDVNKQLDGVVRIVDTGNMDAKYVQSGYIHSGKYVKGRDEVYHFRYELFRILSFTVEF